MAKKPPNLIYPFSLSRDSKESVLLIQTQTYAVAPLMNSFAREATVIVSLLFQETPRGKDYTLFNY